MKIAGVTISHPDKILFPKAGLKKADIVQYYDRVSRHMLPWLKDRPLSLQRFPDGIGEDGFYQKNAPDYFPEFIDRVTIKTGDGSNQQVICNSHESLIYLVNQDCLSFHTWLCRADRLQQPDRIVIDLDPPSEDFQQLKAAARLVRDHFKTGARDPRLMTTGKRGLHVYWSIRRRQDFDSVRQEIKAQAQRLAERHPDLFTTALPKVQRKGRIFIDYLRNAYGQTAICPFSLRPTADATVATPLEWRELGRLDDAGHYNQANLFRRLAQFDRRG